VILTVLAGSYDRNKRLSPGGARRQTKVECCACLRIDLAFGNDF
jgi:hypothetical protein